MPASQRGCFVAGVAVLLIYNVARGFGAFGSFGDASAILLLGAFVALAWMAKLTAVDLGLARADAPRGAMYGIAALIITTAVLVIVAVFEVAIPILLLTVIPEEFAFRGVLLASGRELWRDRGATFVTSALFGLWQISPTLGTLSENRSLDDATTTRADTVLIVAGLVLATFVAGLVFSWLRWRTRSLLAPVVAHSRSTVTLWWSRGSSSSEAQERWQQSCTCSSTDMLDDDQVLLFGRRLSQSTAFMTGVVMIPATSHFLEDSRADVSGPRLHHSRSSTATSLSRGTTATPQDGESSRRSRWTHQHPQAPLQRRSPSRGKRTRSNREMDCCT